MQAEHEVKLDEFGRGMFRDFTIALPAAACLDVIYDEILRAAYELKHKHDRPHRNRLACRGCAYRRACWNVGTTEYVDREPDYVDEARAERTEQ